MLQKEEEKKVKESHTLWADKVLKRTEIYDDESNWYPFMQSIQDILERCSHIDQKIDGLSNEIGETKGMLKNLRKILIKLEVVDDRFII